MYLRFELSSRSRAVTSVTFISKVHSFLTVCGTYVVLMTVAHIDASAVSIDDGRAEVSIPRFARIMEVTYVHRRAYAGRGAESENTVYLLHASSARRRVREIDR